MTTEAQACSEQSRRMDANRTNGACDAHGAQHSTGPKTAEGKARSARNALRHGLRARLIIDNPVDRGDGSRFGALLTDLLAELQPVGVLEEFAVETIATCIWRLGRTVLEELHGAGMTERDRFFAEMEQEWDEEGKKEGYDPPRRDDPALATDQRIALLIRYEAHLYRQYHRAVGDLQRLQASRLAPSVPDVQPPISPSSSAAPPAVLAPVPASGACSPSSPAAPSAIAPAAPPLRHVRFGGTFPFAETFFCQTNPLLQHSPAPSVRPSDPLGRCGPSHRQLQKQPQKLLTGATTML